MVENQADIRNEPIQLTINNDGYISMNVWNLPSAFLYEMTLCVMMWFVLSLT